jgi:hypothetical protein
MTTATQQSIYEASMGNLKVLQFNDANEVLSKLDDIRSKIKQKDPEIYGFSLYCDPAQDRFEEVYDIAPYKLIELLNS